MHIEKLQRKSRWSERTAYPEWLLLYLKGKRGKLTIIYEGTAYDEPVEAMSGILYYRDEGAPYHEAYRFTRFEKDGTMVEEPTYQCYDSNEDGEIGAEDVYLKDGVEQEGLSGSRKPRDTEQ